MSIAPPRRRKGRYVVSGRALPVKAQHEGPNGKVYGDNKAGRPKTEHVKSAACECAHHCGTPKRGSRVEAPHIDALSQNDASAEKADPGNHLRRDPRRVALADRRRKRDEASRA
jgi:hypothetical protein